LRALCLAEFGVAYRRTPSLPDRLPDVRGPALGDVVALLEAPAGGWARCAKGWLPLSVEGQPVVEPLPASAVLRARCLSAQGVAYRASMDMDNRLAGVRGPSGGDEVEVEERFGTWLRTASGWLPLAIGGQDVFELLGDLSPGALASAVAMARQQVAAAQAAAKEAEAERRKGGLFSLALPTLPVAFLTVLGSGLYVGLRASALAFRLWRRAAFGWLPLPW